MKTDMIKKKRAINLRKEGRSIRDIEKTLSVARSTLSGWLCDVELSKKQKEQLHKKWLAALAKARSKAAELNKNNRLKRMRVIEQDAKNFVSDIVINKKLGEIIFSIFYLAEGTKAQRGTVEIASTNPKILVTLLKLFRYLYSPQESRLRCRLNLRLDQSERKLKSYWSKILQIPKSQFIKTQFDKRTIKPTFKNYKGVCSLYYCDTNLQKRIIAIGEELIQLILIDKIYKGA